MTRSRPCSRLCATLLPTLAVGVAMGLAACSPALNWREVDGVASQRWWFPCKPERVERQVSLQGRQVPAQLAACDAQGVTWSTMALAFPTPAEAAEGLAPARAVLMANLQAEETAPPPGLAPAADRPAWWAGRRSGGDATMAVVRFRVQGRWLVQQVLLTQAGPSWPRGLDENALNTFFDGALARP